jgi:ADP-ribose pyrophosphatase YjhB (NUDIX family)
VSSTVRSREAARVIVLSDTDQVLLLRYDEGAGVFWATPGGGLKPGETRVDAALRELAEELGVTGVEPSPEIATRTAEHLVHGEPVLQIEVFYVARIPAGMIDPSQATDPDGILAWQWWTLDDLDRTRQTVYPLGLTALVRRYLAEGAPPHPVALQGG